MPTPGRLDPKGHRALFEAVQRGLDDAQPLEDIGNRYPEVATPAALLGGVTALKLGDRDRAARMLARVVSDPTDVADHPFVTQYLVPRGVSLETSVASGVTAILPLGREVATLTLAELRQSMGDPFAAISLVEDLPPSTVAAVSLAELYVETQQYEEILDLTNGLKNEDEASALLLVFRGSALHALGHHDAAVEALKEALRARSRPPAIRHLALAQRAEAHLALGKRAAARKDLERILAEDASFPGLSERLEAVRSGEVEAAPPPQPPRARPDSPSRRDPALEERDWRGEVEGALTSLAPHIKGATDSQRAHLRDALRAGQVPRAVAFGSVKVDGKSVGLMPIPVCLTDKELIIVAKDGVQRSAVGDLGSAQSSGSKLAGGTLTLVADGRTIEVSGIRPHVAAQQFASHVPASRAADTQAPPEVAATRADLPPADLPPADLPPADLPPADLPSPDWYPDPTERHHYRFWNGTTWTENVATDGAVSTDPIE